MVEAPLALARFAAFAGAAAAAGAALFAPERSERAVAVGGGLLLLSVLALAPIEAVSLTGEGTAALDPAVLGAVLTRTPVGASLFIRGACGLALLLLAPSSLTRRAPKIAAAPALAALGAGALAGHAAGGEGAAGLLRLGVGASHAMAAGLWAGALMSFALEASRRGAGLEGRLRRFGRPGGLLLAWALLTGLFNVNTLAGGLAPAPLLQTAWGQLLMVKLAAVAAMVALAVLNRRILSGRGALPWRLLGASLLAEALLGILVLALVSVLGLLPPV